jgi:hypothetical protein
MKRRERKRGKREKRKVEKIRKGEKERVKCESKLIKPNQT